MHTHDVTWQVYRIDLGAALVALTGKGNTATAWMDTERRTAAATLLAGVKARDVAGFSSQRPRSASN
jgi:hypothetical protein